MSIRSLGNIYRPAAREARRRTETRASLAPSARPDSRRLRWAGVAVRRMSLGALPRSSVTTSHSLQPSYVSPDSSRDCVSQGWQIAFDYLPNSVEIDIPVPMNETVTHTRNRAPGNRWPGRRVIRREAFDRLSDNLEVVDYPDLDELVFEKRVPAAARAGFDPVDRFQDVARPLRVGSQSGTASASTRALCRSRSDAAVPTSTRLPRSFSRSSSSLARSIRERPASRSTSRSMSLISSASSRTTEPKSLMFRAPCRAAVSLMSAAS